MPSKKEKRVEGRWRLDFNKKNRERKVPESDVDRRSRIKAWLEHNYPHVVRDEDKEFEAD